MCPFHHSFFPSVFRVSDPFVATHRRMFWNHLISVICCLSCIAFIYELAEFVRFTSHAFEPRTTLAYELFSKTGLRRTPANTTSDASVLSFFVPESTTKAPSSAYILEMKRMEQLRQSYLEQLKKRQQTPLEDNPESTKYVIFHPLKAGLGNSLATIMDAFLVAMLTDRKFYSTFHCSPHIQFTSILFLIVTILFPLSIIHTVQKVFPFLSVHVQISSSQIVL